MSLMNFETALHYAERGIGNLMRIKKNIVGVYELMGSWRKALLYYEYLLSNHTEEEISFGYIYERAASICLELGEKEEFRKNMKLAVEWYKKEGNYEKIDTL